MRVFGKFKMGWGALVLAVVIVVSTAWPFWQVIQQFERVGDERVATRYFDQVLDAMLALDGDGMRCGIDGSRACWSEAFMSFVEAMPESPPRVLSHIDDAHDKFLESMVELIQVLDQSPDQLIMESAQKQPEIFRNAVDAWEAWRTAAFGSRYPTPQPGKT